MNISAKYPFVLYSDDDWLIVDKPSGLPTHGGDNGDLGVHEWLLLHCDLQTFVCSRLDIGTSGVLLLARHASASARAQQIHIDSEAEKVYYFLSDIDARHSQGESWVCEYPLDGKEARTEIAFDAQLSPKIFRYRATICRGRTHQIRRHAAMSGCAILGDMDYKGGTCPRLALHCAEITWPGITEKIKARLPALFLSETHEHGKAIAESFVALERRGALLSSVTSAWRVVQRGEVSECDFSLDIYGNYGLFWIYDDSEYSFLQEKLKYFIQFLQQHFGLKGIVFRRVVKNPHKKGLVQDIFVMGESPSEQFVVTEHGWKIWVTLTSRQHVGLFLDHRDNRRRLQLSAKGKRVANLFSYTCAFGIVAALSDCEIVMNVDAAASSLGLGKKNFELNVLHQARTGKFVEKDVRIWLEKQLNKIVEGGDPAWDVIICDPPTFSLTQKGGSFQVGEEWSSLAKSCASILKSDGVCYFSTNSQSQNRSVFEKSLRDFFGCVQRIRPPLDFPEIVGRTHAYFFECRNSLFSGK